MGDCSAKISTFFKTHDILIRSFVPIIRFMLGPWLESAKKLGSSPSEKALFEFNSRNQITLWGPDGQIMDYAAKQWSGLIQDYYAPRWRMFFQTLEDKVGGDVFNEKKFRREFVERLGRPFTLDRKVYPVDPVGDSVEVALKLYKKWRPFV